MHDEIEILDVEKGAENFKVVFEVPGAKYDQNYPKRLSHSFPLKEHFFREDQDGVKRWEKVLRKNYVGDSKKDDEIKNKVDDVRNNLQGKKLCKDDEEQKVVE